MRRRSPAERVRRGRALPRLRARAQTVWEPRPTSPALISGDARVGGTLTCTPPAFDAPVDAATFHWLDRDLAVVATGPSYTVQTRDSGRDISCEVTASTAGGPATTTANVTIAH